MSVLIRKAVNADVSALLVLIAQARSFHNGLTDNYFADIDPNMERGFLEKGFQEKDAFFLVAQEENIIVGLLLAYFRNLPYLRRSSVCQIDTVCVEERYRHKGIGRLLMQNLKRECQQKGIDEIQLSVYAANPDAVRFYESFGFKVKAFKMSLKP